MDVNVVHRNIQFVWLIAANVNRHRVVAIRCGEVADLDVLGGRGTIVLDRKIPGERDRLPARDCEPLAVSEIVYMSPEMPSVSLTVKFTGSVSERLPPCATQ